MRISNITGRSWLLPLLLFSACAPAPVYRLHLLDPEAPAEWNWGKEVAFYEDNAIDYELAYVNSSAADHLFELRVVNRSDENVVVDPGGFYYVAYKANSVELLEDTLFASDPEAELLEIDKKASREDAQHRTARVLDAVDTTVDLIDDIAQAGDRTAEERLDEHIEDVDRAVYRLEMEGGYDRTMRNLNEERRHWELATLRKTTLPPGYEMTGLVYFPVRKKTVSMRISLPVGLSEGRFSYRVQTIKP